MMKLIIILLSIALLFWIIALMVILLLIVRNNQVYRFRTSCIYSDEIYNKLPDYDTMVNYFWIPLKDYDYWTNFKYPEAETFIEAIINYIKYKWNH